MFLIRLKEISSFALFLIVSPILFISNVDSLSDLTISITSSISSFDTIDAAVPDVKSFFWKTASVAAATATAGAVNS